MAIYRQQLDPATELTLSLALVRDVKNCGAVRGEVISGNLQACVMKASLIVDPFQVVVAANRAALAHCRGSAVTKSVFTEILFNLSISKNITQSLAKFGVGDSDRDVIVAVLDKVGENNIDEALSRIEGKIAPLHELSDIMDRKVIMKSYKIGESECNACSLVDSIVSRITCSDFVSV